MRTVNPKAKPRQSGRTRDASATRAALVEAATQLFNGPGYFATDSNAIARAAGYAPATFYKHFEDKAAILLAVYEAYGEAEWQGLHAAMAGATTPQTRLPRALAFIADFHGSWAPFRTGIRAVARIEPAVAAALQKSRARQLELLAETTGLKPAKHGAALLLALTFVERLGDTLAEAAHLTPQITRASILAAAERALLPLLSASKP